MLIFAGLLSLVAGILITYISPLPGICLLGIFNSFRVALLFPLISSHVDCPKTIGLWFSMIKFVENFLGCIIFSINGTLYNIFGSYDAIMFISICFTIFGFIAAIFFMVIYGNNRNFM